VHRYLYGSFWKGARCQKRNVTTRAEYFALENDSERTVDTSTGLRMIRVRLEAYTAGSW